MNKLFIADRDFSREIPRTCAHGYKSITIDPDVQLAAPYEFQTDGDTLVAMPVDAAEGEVDCYTMLCSEFGLIGGSTGARSQVSVIFCDNGMMLVTLYHGCLVMNLDDQLLMPIVGNDVVQPKVVKSQIMWVNADKLMGYKQYLGEKGYFMYDYEFMLELGGDNIKGMGNFIFRQIDGETIDISRGYIAQYEQNQIKKQEANEAKKLAAVALNYRPSGQMEFDEPDPAEESEEDDGDDGVEW